MSWTSEEITQMHNMKPVRCADCRFYKSDCGYWRDGRRDKGGNPVTRVAPTDEHKCLDFKPRGGTPQ